MVGTVCAEEHAGRQVSARDQRHLPQRQFRLRRARV